MEHRWSRRTVTDMEAILEYPPLGLVRGTVRDASPGGLFVETGPVTLQVNTPVHVTVKSGTGLGAAAHRLQAVVVWVGRGGAGMMFRAFDEPGYRALGDLLHGAAPTAGRSSAVKEPASASAQTKHSSCGRNQRGQ